MFDTLTRMGASAAGAYEIKKSLRFNRPDDTYLSRTPSSAGNRRTFTLSCWVKAFGDGRFIEAGSASGTNGSGFMWIDRKPGFIYDVGATWFTVRTAGQFRDISSWYHVVWQIDTTQADGANRVKIFVNGVSQSMTYTASSGTHIPQNTDLHINNTIVNSFGRRTYDTAEILQANVAEVHFLDGTITAPTAWGETDITTGQWIPKEYEGGNYGTNGFYLDFFDNSDTTATTLGKDSSGQGNNWTPSNFSVAAGTGDDSSEDTPTNNYCTLHSESHRMLTAPTNGNLDLVIPASATNKYGVGTFAVDSGKWYWECNYVADTSDYLIVGVGDGQEWAELRAVRGNDGELIPNTGTVAVSFGDGDVIMVALDCGENKWWIGKNGSWMLSGDPANGTGYVHNNITSAVPVSPIFYNATGSGSQSISVNFGARGFTHTPPTGFKALCTKNLPTPTIKDGTKYFNTVLYEGTGSLLTSPSVGFQPDLTWVKNRDDTDDQVLQDSERGNKVFTGINDNDVEGDTGGGWITEIADGFTVDANGQANTNGESFVGWCWKEGASNGFTMSTFTPSSGASTYSHSLGVKPDLILFKCRTEAAAWDVYHSSLTADYKLYFNDSVAKIDSAFMNDTEPTSSVFTYDPGSQNGDVHIAYCFSSVSGYLKAHRYTGNGNANGPFVYTGFRVAYLLIKNADRGANWTVYDVKRESQNPIDQILEPNINNAEETGHDFDFLSNGFKVRNTNNSFNANGEKMVYLAIAETPFKYANAR